MSASMNSLQKKRIPSFQGFVLETLTADTHRGCQACTFTGVSGACSSTASAACPFPLYGEGRLVPEAEVAPLTGVSETKAQGPQQRLDMRAAQLKANGGSYTPCM